jgi:DNA-binding GntR family transcriptional regulator
VTVAAPSVQNVLNLIHVRSVLEPEVARLVAEIAPTDVVESLRTILAKMERAAEANDRAAWSRADTEWHETLGRACPNSLLAELTLQMRNRAHAISIDGQTSQSRLVTCTTEHQRVVEAIAAHDTRAAEEAMRQHIFELRESMFRRLTHS